MVGCGNCGHKWKPRGKEFPKECPECRTPTSPGPFYIENRKPVGNCMMFWREGGHGYGCNLAHIGSFSLEEAWRICRSRPDIDTMWPAAFIASLAVGHIDVQSLKHGPGHSR